MRSPVRAAFLLVPLAMALPVGAGVVLDLANPTDDVRIIGGEPGGQLSVGWATGSGLLVADVNVDGRPDLVVASARATPDRSRLRAGEVRVLLGPFVSRTVHDPVDGAAALTILGATLDEQLGVALAVGDLDGDGAPDLAITAGGPIFGSGRVVVIFGPLPLAGDVLDLLSSPPDWTIVEEDASDGLGVPLLVADLDADGQDDLVMGSPGADGVGNARRGSGEVRIIFGPLAHGDHLRAADADLVIRGDLAVNLGRDGSEYGQYLKAADIDRDGKLDLIVGAPNAGRIPGPESLRRGEVHVFFGPLAAGDIDLAVTPPDVLIRGGSSGRGSTYIGHSPAVGDLDGDGALDMVFGGLDFDPLAPELLDSRGYVGFLRGPFTRGQVVDMDLRPADRLLFGVDQLEFLGAALALGDLDADGNLDLVVGAFREGGGLVPAVPGIAHVVKGPLLPGPSMVLDASSADITVLGSRDGDALGRHVLVADMSGDGRDDVILGAPLCDRPNNVGTSEGSVHILFGDPGNRPPTCALSVPPRVECADAPPCGAAGRMVTLDGSASSDPDLDIVEHRWHVACPGGAQDLAGAVVDACLPFDCGGACDVMLTVLDARGNQASCSANVEMLDETPPTITADPAAQVLLWAPNHRMHCFDVASFTPRVADDCDPAPTWRFLGCLSNQPDDDRGDGHFSPDCTVSADGSQVCVRAERSGVRGERRVRLFGVALDACGNESAPAEAGVVIIRHDQRRRGR